MTEDLPFYARVQYVIDDSLARMPADEQARRVAYCQQHDQHGVRQVVEDGLLRLTWGGSLLAVVELDVFDDDAYLKPLDATEASLPDFPPDGTL